MEMLEMELIKRL